MNHTTTNSQAWAPGATVVYLGWTEAHAWGLVVGTVEQVEHSSVENLRYLVTPDHAPGTTVMVDRPRPSDRVRGGINARQATSQ